MKYYLGIDLGGTNIAVGVVDEQYNIVGRKSLRTRAPRPAEEIVEDMEKACRMALKDAGLSLNQVEWAGIGSPGIANPETGKLEFSNNLQFYDAPLVQLLSGRLDKLVYLENDANAAAYGEALAGAGKGVRNLLMITLGTGFGGGIIIDGKIYGGAYHGGGEIGHVGMRENGRPCTCGRKGCIEAYCSATGLIKLTREEMQEDRSSLMWKLAENSLDNVSGRTSFDAMRQGDAAGKKVVRQYTEHLGYAIVSLINMFQPEILVVGGGISHESDTLLPPIRERVAKEAYDRYSKQHTQVVPATLGNDAGIIGAAFLGKHAVL